MRAADHVVEREQRAVVWGGSPAKRVGPAEPGRYLIFLTPGLDRLIARLHSLSRPSELRATLAEFDTVLAE